jgi:hypothetical protein
MRTRLTAASLTAALALLVAVIVAGAASVLVNGDFETGDLSGWGVFTTDNGYIGIPAVVAFDVTGDGAPSLAVRLTAGERIFEPGCEFPTGGFDPVCRHANPDFFEGGGVGQTMDVSRDTVVTVSADVAASNVSTYYLATSGKFELVVNGTVVDTAFKTSMAPGEVFRDVLSGEVTLAAGPNTVAVRVTSPWGAPPDLRQYIDNVVVSPLSRGEVLQGRGVPGNGVDRAPGLGKEFKPGSAAGDHAGGARHAAGAATTP